MQPIKWDYVTAPGTHIVQTEIIKYLQCYGELGMYVLYVCIYMYVCMYVVYVTCLHP